MSTTVRIRSCRSDDLAQVEALWERVPPYRPEDQAAVEAMYQRAGQAREAEDSRWMPRTPAAAAPESAADADSTVWVAVLHVDSGADQVVGFAEASPAGAVSQMSPTMPLGREWRNRNDVAELRRLSVAPELWRQGIGTQLSQTAIGWCRDSEFRTIVLNTTSAQGPALALYRKLGFREAARSFLGEFELVWFELELSP